jgi:methylated-DNA-[protein]-cysteine S-methyltransferase
MHRIYVSGMNSPLGRIRVAGDDRALLRVLLPCANGRERLTQELARVYGPVDLQHDGEIPSLFLEELSRYFQGKFVTFRTPVRPHGTAFQKRVWKILARIPYGETRSYGWVAKKAGVPGGARAVGQANARNPVPIMVPCHRVVAGDGTLGGFSSGVEHKKLLLRMEKRL